MASRRRRLRVKGGIRGLIGATKRQFRRDRSYLDSYERELILSDARELARGKLGVSHVNLIEHAPGRYDERYLKNALASLHERGDLTNRRRYRGGWGRRSWYTYDLPAVEDRVAA